MWRNVALGLIVACLFAGSLGVAFLVGRNTGDGGTVKVIDCTPVSSSGGYVRVGGNPLLPPKGC